MGVEWRHDCASCLYQTEGNREFWCNECVKAQIKRIERKPTGTENLISREALIEEITAEMRLSELAGYEDEAIAYSKALSLIDKAHVWGTVNPTQTVFGR